MGSSHPPSLDADQGTPLPQGCLAVPSLKGSTNFCARKTIVCGARGPKAGWGEVGRLAAPSRASDSGRFSGRDPPKENETILIMKTATFETVIGGGQKWLTP